MKKAICLLLIPVLLLASACIKEKDYVCECTYVPSATGSSAGQANKVERENMKATIRATAEVNCSGLEDKYYNQNYSGSCLLK